MKTWAKLTMVIAAVALLAGCSAKSSGPAAEVTIKAESLAYGTKEITLEKGKTYKIVLNNTDSQLHDFSVDKIEGKLEHKESAQHGHGGAKEPDLHVAAEAGKSASITFTPTREGTYTFYCTVQGHKEAGMTGKIVVK